MSEYTTVVGTAVRLRKTSMNVKSQKCYVSGKLLCSCQVNDTARGSRKRGRRFDVFRISKKVYFRVTALSKPVAKV
jgi:hypothetical protein